MKIIIFCILSLIFSKDLYSFGPYGLRDHLIPWSVSDKSPVIHEDKLKNPPSNRYETKSSPYISLVWWINFYRLFSSKQGKCTFLPSCSEYTRLAILKHGFLLGSVMGAERLMRYHNDYFSYKVIDAGNGLRLIDPVQMNDFWFSTRNKKHE